MTTTQVASPFIALVGGEPSSARREEQGPPGLMARHRRPDVKDRAPNGQRFTVIAKHFGAVRVARTHGAHSSFIRARHHLADGRDLVSFVISNGSRFLLEGVQGAGHFGPHSGAMLESQHASALHKLDDATGVWSICIERAALEPLLSVIETPVQRCLGGDNPGLRLLDGYLSLLFALEQDHDPVLAGMHIRDLVLSALGVRGDVQARVKEGGVHAARRSAVLDTIRRRAGETGLNPADVAKQSGISVRYLHQLLEPTGQTFAQHLLEQRLERALATLRNPDRRLKIADVAFASGFSDISHFNRSFRRKFGDTPFGVRVRAMRAQQQNPASKHSSGISVRS